MTADRSRWIALYVLCLGMLMIVLDVTVVNVALPSIQNDLGFSVSMTKKLALKLAYQVRYNSDVALGFKKTDQLLTTNLVYGF